jgi:hypothetical protein
VFRALQLIPLYIAASRARIARQQRTSANLHLHCIMSLILDSYLSDSGSFISVDEKRRLPAELASLSDMLTSHTSSQKAA